MLRLSQLGYTYSKGGDCPAAINVASAAGGEKIGASANEQAFALAGPTRLERGVTTVPISVPPAAREMLSAQAMPAERRYVVIEQVRRGAWSALQCLSKG
jgi:hypothetical protein